MVEIDDGDFGGLVVFGDEVSIEVVTQVVQEIGVMAESEQRSRTMSFLPTVGNEARTRSPQGFTLKVLFEQFLTGRRRFATGFGRLVIGQTTSLGRYVPRLCYKLCGRADSILQRFKSRQVGRRLWVENVILQCLTRAPGDVVCRKHEGPGRNSSGESSEIEGDKVLVEEYRIGVRVGSLIGSSAGPVDLQIGYEGPTQRTRKRLTRRGPSMGCMYACVCVCMVTGPGGNELVVIVKDAS